MQSIFRNTLVKPGAAIALAVAGLLGGPAAQAAGTASNTTISNLATLNYSVGTVTQSPIGSSAGGNTTGAGTSTDFLVDNKVNLTVTTSDPTFVTVVPGVTLASATANQIATFVVTNTGNTVQDFGLTTLFNYTGSTANVFTTTTVNDTFDPSACSIKVGAATSPTYAGATAATYIDELAADASRTVYVVCAIPLTAVDADIAVISLTAQVLAGGTAGTQGGTLTPTAGANTNNLVDIVFANAAGTEGTARDGKSSSRDAFKVSSAKLTVTKTATPVCDPFNGNVNPKNIPGSFVSYTITIANTSSTTTSAILTTITDDLTGKPVTLDPDLIFGTTAANCITGGTPTSAAGSGFVIAKGAVNGRTSAFPKYFTTTSSVDGVDFSTTTNIITATFATALPAESGYAAGELKAGESVSLSFQVKIN